MMNDIVHGNVVESRRMDVLAAELVMNIAVIAQERSTMSIFEVQVRANLTPHSSFG